MNGKSSVVTLCVAAFVVAAPLAGTVTAADESTGASATQPTPPAGTPQQVFPALQLRPRTLYTVSAVAVLIGFLLLTSGLKAGRLYMALFGAAAGAALGGPVANRLNVHVTAATIASVIVCGILCLIAARAIWALLVGILFAAVAAGVAGYLLAGEAMAEAAGAFPPAGALTDAALAKWRDLGVQVWQTENRAVLLLSSAVAGVTAYGLGLLKPRLATAFMTSLIGVVLMEAGAACAASRLAPGLLSAAAQYSYVPAGIAAALIVVGMFVQYRLAPEAEPARKTEGTGGGKDARKKE